MSVNKSIKNYLEETGITESNLAKKAGMSRQTLNRLLGGEFEDIKLSQYIKICQALGLPYQYFIGENTPAMVNEGNLNYGSSRRDITQNLNLGEQKCREELEEARKRIIELQERVIELMGKK